MWKEQVVGYCVDTRSAVECAVDIVQDFDKDGGRRWLACFNPHSYAVARKDRKFQLALKNSTYLMPDGVGVVLASRILGGEIRKRVTGFDVFSSVHEKMNEKEGMSVFFLGSTEETLKNIQAKMQVDYPNVVVAGTYSPPFKSSFSEQDDSDMIRAVNAVSPDVLWVGMTAPKQEKWIVDVLERLDVKFVAAIGAVFDFYSGQVRRSHPIFQRLGLEWLPRLVQEPRRLWRRMFVSAPIFVWHVFRLRVGRTRD